tara:strand:- start:25602 stop:26375 length:774 start_codon:yes stop_codon:yes gene_type:complete
MNGEVLKYFSLQGEFSLHEIINGLPGPGRMIGECSAAEFSATPTVEKFKENTSGARGIDLVIDQGTEGALSLTLHKVNTAQLELLLGGQTHLQDTTAVADELLVATPEVGQRLLLGAFDVASAVIKDSTPSTPKTLTVDVNYTIDPKTGTIDIIDLTTGGPFVGPLTKSFTPGTDITYVKMLTDTQREWWGRFNGINTLGTKPRMVYEWYRLQTSPASMQLINESRGEVVLSATVLSDTSKAVDDEFGLFGRAVILD